MPRVAGRGQPVALLALALLLLPAACTRPRPEPTPALPSEAQVDSAIRPERPRPGDELSSPIGLAGRVEIEAGQMLVAQALVRQDERLAWRGNATIEVDADGNFSGQLAYTLAEPGPGFIELLLVDAAGGTPIATHRIPVELAATP